MRWSFHPQRKSVWLKGRPCAGSKATIVPRTFVLASRMTTLQEAAWLGAVPWSFTFAWKLQVAPGRSAAPQSLKFRVRGDLNCPTSCSVRKVIGVLPKLTTSHATISCCCPPKTGPEANVEAAWAVPAIPHARTTPERTSLRIDVLLLATCWA